MERPSDCARWIEQGHATMIDGGLAFTEKFYRSAQRHSLEYDPIGFDDGVPRRWAIADSGGIGVLQLRPISEVGTGTHVSHKSDDLLRRQSTKRNANDPEGRHLPGQVRS